MSSSPKYKGDVPAAWRRDESRLIRAMEAPLEERKQAIEESLIATDWNGNEYLVCIGLAETTRTLEKQFDRKGSARFAEQMRPYCEGWRGSSCEDAPLLRCCTRMPSSSRYEDDTERPPPDIRKRVHRRTDRRRDFTQRWG